MNLYHKVLNKSSQVGLTTMISTSKYPDIPFKISKFLNYFTQSLHTMYILGMQNTAVQCTRNTIQQYEIVYNPHDFTIRVFPRNYK